MICQKTGDYEAYINRNRITIQIQYAYNWLYLNMSQVCNVDRTNITGYCMVSQHGNSRAITTEQRNLHGSTVQLQHCEAYNSRRCIYWPHGRCHLKRHKTLISFNIVFFFRLVHKGRIGFLPRILASGYIWNLLSFDTIENRILTTHAKYVNT